LQKDLREFLSPPKIQPNSFGVKNFQGTYFTSTKFLNTYAEKRQGGIYFRR
jgi:hypothetical protein